MKRRNMQGIPEIGVSFETINERHVHRQVILHDIIALGRGTRSTRVWAFDPLNRVWSSNHLFRASVTLAGAA